MALRIKSEWFREDKPRSAAQSASAMAFIIFRVAQNALKQMRVAQFDIDPGPQYFAFLREFLVFLIQIADRIAYARLDAQLRIDFTTAVAIRVGEILEDNENDLLGLPGEKSYTQQFIDLFNDRSSDYAEFQYKDGEPEFAFLRYLGSRVRDIMVKKDHAWVIDQIMAIEAPEAMAHVERGMQGLFAAAPRRARKTRMSGD
jgi:hypothetical protein